MSVSQSPNPRRWFRRGLGLLALIGLVSLPITAALAASGRGPGGCDKRPTSAAEVREHLDRGATWVLDDVNVSDAQRATIDQSLDGLAPTLFASSQDGRALREDMLDALVAGDAVAVEASRQEAIDLFDSTTRAVSHAAVTIANVLTPEQREALADRLPDGPPGHGPR